MHDALSPHDTMQSGVHSNHHTNFNRLNGEGVVDTANGGYTGTANGASSTKAEMEAPAHRMHDRMHDLPDEVRHITVGMVPLSSLVTRLAQFSHNQLQGTIMTLASKPVTQAITNGVTDTRGINTEDTNPESLEKKRMLLDFLNDLHGKWVKALVLTEWAKKADAIGKVIDLREYLRERLALYDRTWDFMVQTKHQMRWAMLPGPDLRTALQVLGRGEALFMPEEGYIEPPAISDEEQNKWLEDINTLLSVRLSLEEYDKIPPSFRDYTVKSGRVTFRVPGEFEVDLTITSDNFDSQFFFVDFRFAFQPAPLELTEHVRDFFDLHANAALGGGGGLAACYSLLHEFVLTHKIGTLHYQTIELGRRRWVNALNLERLQRAMSIQYWRAKPGPPNWIIIGVNGVRTNGSSSASATSSHLSIRWFRDQKEVKDVTLPFDTDEISAEKLLFTVTGKHITHLLTSMHEKLVAKPRFASRQARITLKISQDDAIESSLKIQILNNYSVTLSVDAVSGAFAIAPVTSLTASTQRQLNSSPNPVEEVVSIIEGLRCRFVVRELSIRSRGNGWEVLKQPAVKTDELKPILQPRGPYQAVWLGRLNWTNGWCLMLSLSLTGDSWWLLETSQSEHVRVVTTIRKYARLPFTNESPSLSEDFFHGLTAFVSGIVAHVTDKMDLRQRQVLYGTREAVDVSTMYIPPSVRLPVLLIRLSDLLRVQGRRPRIPWARDHVMLTHRGVQAMLGDVAAHEAPIYNILEARLFATDRYRFRLLTSKVDRNVLYNERAGQWAIRLRVQAGKSFLPQLETYLRSLHRLASFLDAIRREGNGVSVLNVTLNGIVFQYGGAVAQDHTPVSTTRAWHVGLKFTSGKNVKLSLQAQNPHLRIKDYIQKLAERHFESVPGFLRQTLPFHQALDKIEDNWAKLMVNGQGAVEFFPRPFTAMTIRYTLSPGAKRARQLQLEVQPQSRSGETMWFISRQDSDRGQDGQVPVDEFSEPLRQHVWSSAGTGWLGLETGAASDLEAGIQELLTVIDSTVRSLLGVPQVPRLDPNAGLSQSKAGELMAVSARFPQASQPRLSQNGTPGTSESQGPRSGVRKNTVVVLSP